MAGLVSFTHTCPVCLTQSACLYATGRQGRLFAHADRSENKVRANVWTDPKPHTRQAQSTKLQAPSLPALTAVRQTPCSMPTCPVASIIFSGKQGYSNSALLPKNTQPPAPCFEPMTPEGSHVYRKKWQIKSATPEWVEPPVGLRTPTHAPLSFWRASPDACPQCYLFPRISTSSIIP